MRIADSIPNENHAMCGEFGHTPRENLSAV
jgi:hypothetical protein